jgi:hypothetical protein
LLILTVLSVAGLTKAQPLDASVTLTLDAPATSDCIDAAELQARVEQRARISVFSAGPAKEQRSIVVHIRPAAAAGYQAVLKVFDTAGLELGSRRLESAAPSCRGLDDPLIVVVSTLLGLGGLVPPDPQPSPAEPPPPPPPPPAPVAAPITPAPSLKRARIFRVGAQRSEPWHWGLALGAGLGSGSLPGSYFVGSAGVLGEWRALILQVGALSAPHVTRDLGAGAEASLANLIGRFQTCGVMGELVNVRIGFCAGLKSGAIFAKSRGLARNASARLRTSDIEFGLRLAGPPSARLGIGVSLLATLPLHDTELFVSENGGIRKDHTLGTPGVLAELSLIFRPAS